MLDRPDFTLDEPNRLYHTTDAEWWLWLRLHELEPASRLGGIYANKSGFHNTGNNNERYWPGNYSIRDTPNRRGPWWREYASAIDWTFPDAQAGNYTTIAKYTKRLFASALNPADPRLPGILFEWYGNDDNDRHVEGYDVYHRQFVTSDSSHLWHIHLSFLRDRCGDMWAMWGLLTVLMGWSVEQWRASLPEQPPAPPPAPAPTPVPPPSDWTEALIMSLPTLRRGASGRTVKRLQGLLLSHNPALGSVSWIDGAFGPATEDGVKRFQRAYDLAVDGIVGQQTWTKLVTR